MSQQSVRQAARRSALDAQAALRKERADRERRLEGLAVEVLTALGERDAVVRDAERRAGQALQTMTDDEGLSVREAVDWCGSGGVTCGRSAGYANLCTTRLASAADKRALHRPARPIRLAIAVASLSAYSPSHLVRWYRRKFGRKTSHSAAERRLPWADPLHCGEEGLAV